MVVHLNAQVLEERHTRCAGHRTCGFANLIHRDAGLLRVRLHRQRLVEGKHFVEPDDVLLDEGLVAESLLNDHGNQSRQQPGVRSGLHRHVDVGHVRRLRPFRVDHDHLARRILLDLLQRHTRTRHAVRLPGILPEKERHFAVFEVTAHDAAEHLAVDPELPGLLLRQCVRPVNAAEDGERAP